MRWIVFNRLVIMVLLTTLRAQMRRGAVIAAVISLLGCAGPEEKAQSYYQRGNEYLAQKDYAKAAIEFRNALQLKKNLVDAWRGLLRVEEQGRDFKNQVPILRNIVELDPKDGASKVKLGRYSLMLNAVDLALELANGAIELDSKSAAALSLRAAVQLKLHDSAGAKRDAEAALVIDPAAAEPIIVLAADQVERGNIDAAIDILNREPQAKDIGVQLLSVALFERKGDLKKVEEILRNLAEKNPNATELRTALVKLYIKQKRTDEAEKELRALAAADPSNVEASLNVVRFLMETKGAVAARGELSVRVKAGGEVFPYQLALAEFDFTQGGRADAIRSLEDLVKTARPQDALTAQTKLAQFNMSLRQFEPAQELLSQVLRKDSRNVEALKLQGAIKLEQGKIDEAISDLRQALNDQPRSSELMRLLASAYERSGSIELAEKQFADATNVSGFDPVAGLQYVNFLRRRGNLERAEDVLTELVRRSPGNPRVLTALADVRLARQDWVGAQKIAETLQQTEAGTAAQITAAALNGRGDYNDSIKVLESAYATDPTGGSTMAALVGTMVRGQQADRALAFLRGLLKANPGNAEARVLLGSVLLVKKSPKEALEQFGTVIKEQPKFAGAYVALSGYHLGEKNYNEAEKVLRAGLAQSPDDFSTRMSLAVVLEAKQDYEGAIPEYERLLKQQPGSLIVANNLASLLTEYRTDKASLDRAYSLTGVLRKSPLAPFKDTLGWIYHLRGDTKAAIPLLEEAATAMLDRATVQYHLGMSYLADGQVEKASNQFKKALALNPDPTLQNQIRTAQQKAAL